VGMRKGACRAQGLGARFGKGAARHKVRGGAYRCHQASGRPAEHGPCRPGAGAPWRCHTTLRATPSGPGWQRSRPPPRPTASRMKSCCGRKGAGARQTIGSHLSEGCSDAHGDVHKTRRPTFLGGCVPALPGVGGCAAEGRPGLAAIGGKQRASASFFMRGAEIISLSKDSKMQTRVA